MKIFLAVAVLMAGLGNAPKAVADTVLLENGANLVGTVAKFDGKELTLETDYAGEIKVQWSSVREITSESPVYVVTRQKQTMSGKLSTSGSNLVVHTSHGDVSVAFAEVTGLRSEHEEVAYEKSLHPGLLDSWSGGFNLGFALARGNSETTNLNTAVNANRKTLSDQLTLTETSIYSTSGLPGGGVTANAILGGARYNRNLRKRLFAFVSADFTHDELQALDLRQIYSAGLGLHLINKPTTALDVLAGGNYTREAYSTGITALSPASSVMRNIAGVTLGDDFMHKFGGATVLTEQFYFYPDLTNTGEYRFSFDAAAVTKIGKWLGWQVSISDRYVSDPPILGTKANDIILSTGINIAFSH